MKVLFSDIDNTLIFSYRKNNGGMNVVAEYLNGKEQSFMTQDLYKFLFEHNNFETIPVTTRTIEQYNRLFIFSQDFRCEFALVCNGGLLLKNGIVDETWRTETLMMTIEQNKEVRRLLDFIKKQQPLVKLNPVDEFMFYAVFDDTNIEKVFLKIKKEADLNQVFVEKDARKIYVIAQSANKGLAVQRFKNTYPIFDCVVAGDSSFDIPMINGSHKAIASKDLIGKIKNDNAIFSKRENLAFDIENILNNEMGV